MSLDNLLNVLGKAYYYIGLLLLGGGVAAVLLGVLLSRRSIVVPGLVGIFFGVRMVGGLAVQLGGTIVEEALPAFKSTVFKLVFAALVLPVLLGPSIFGMRINGFTVARWTIAGFLFLAGFGVFAAGYMTYWKRSLVRDTSTSRIRSLAIGHVEVKGSVAGQDDERIVAPLSGEQCLLYQYEIKDHDPEEGWRELDTGAMGVPFLIDDGTGQVLVDPADAELYLSGGLDLEVEGGDRVPETIRQASKRTRSLRNRELEQLRNLEGSSDMELAALDDLIQTAETSPHDRRFTEHTLQQGDGLYVFGKARELEEREDRRQNAARLVIDGEESRFFALSNMPEEELVDRLGTHVVVKIAGGVLISVLGAAGLLWGAGMLVLPSVL